MKNQTLNKDNLEKLYQEEFKPMVPEIEQMWSEASAKFTRVRNFGLIFPLVTPILTFFFFTPPDPEIALWRYVVGFTFIASLFLFLTLVGVKHTQRNKLDILFKPLRSKMIIACCNSIGKNMSYEKDGKNSKEFKNEMKDLFTRFDAYQSSDKIVGEIDGTPIEFFELKLFDTSKDEDGNTHYHSRYVGYVIVVDIKNYPGTELAFIPNGSKFWGAKTRPKLFSGKRKVNLESIEFEKTFDVYSNDQIMARKFFNPAFMEYFVEFEKQIKNSEKGRKKGIHGGLIGGKFILAVSSSLDRFELDTKKGNVFLRKFFDDAIEELDPIVKTVKLLKYKT